MEEDQNSSSETKELVMGFHCLSSMHLGVTSMQMVKEGTSRILKICVICRNMVIQGIR